MRSGHLDGRVQVGALDHVVAADLLFGLRVWPVGYQHLAIADTKDPGLGGIAESAAVQPYPPAGHLVHPRPDSTELGRSPVGPRLGGVVVPEHEHVLHESSIVSPSPSRRRTGATIVDIVSRVPVTNELPSLRRPTTTSPVLTPIRSASRPPKQPLHLTLHPE